MGVSFESLADAVAVHVNHRQVALRREFLELGWEKPVLLGIQAQTPQQLGPEHDQHVLGLPLVKSLSAIKAVPRGWSRVGAFRFAQVLDPGRRFAAGQLADLGLREIEHRLRVDRVQRHRLLRFLEPRGRLFQPEQSGFQSRPGQLAGD